jgi:hypothetical protein
LIATSPIVQQFGTLVMLELPGCALVLLAFAAYLWWAKSRTSAPWIVVCALTTALFFTKYNYALLWMAALGIAGTHEFGRTTARRWWQRAVRRARSRRPFDVFVAIYLLLLLVILLTGGWSGSVAGMRISVRSIGNPLYGLLAICLVRAAIHPFASARRLAGAARALPREARLFATFCGIPIGLWLIAPLHLREFVSFLANRSAGPPAWTAAGSAYYVRSFLADYSAVPWIGWVVLLGALVSALAWRRLGPGERVAPVAFFLGLVASTLHAYKEPRFLFTVAPFAWVSFAFVLAAIRVRPASGCGTASRRDDSWRSARRARDNHCRVRAAAGSGPVRHLEWALAGARGVARAPAAGWSRRDAVAARSRTLLAGKGSRRAAGRRRSRSWCREPAIGGATRCTLVDGVRGREPLDGAVAAKAGCRSTLSAAATD